MTALKRCSKCGESKIEGNFFKGGPLCGHCWMEETSDWYQQLMREKQRIDYNEHKRIEYKHRPESSRTKDKKYMRQYNADNAEKIREQKRQWATDNPEKMRENGRRRRSREAGLPDTFTGKDESHALDYFNGRCAACERPLTDLFGDHTGAMDHWIALSDPRPDNPGTVPANMIPLCHGVDGCNNKKGNADPVEWLEREFGKRKAVQILERIETYFKSVDK